MPTIQKLPTGDNYVQSPWYNDDNSQTNYFQRVDDPIGTPDTATYIHIPNDATFGWFVAEFTHADFAVPAGAVDISLTLYARALYVVGGEGCNAYTPQLYHCLYTTNPGAGRYYGAVKNLTTSWANYSHTWSTNPNTDAAWTPDGINGVTGFGVRSRRVWQEYIEGLQNAGEEVPRVTQVYAQILYTLNEKPHVIAGIGVVGSAKAFLGGSR